MMTPRDRVLAILNRQPVDRIPVDLWHTPEVVEMLKQHFRVADETAIWKALGLDKIVWDFMDYRTDLGESAGAQSGAGAEGGASRTMWGVPLKGIDPIQHVCPGMDRAALKRNYGERVIFHGGVDNQFALPRGTAEDVRRETRACLDTLGAGNAGYICCSCHNVQAGTPVENVLAMVETVRTI